MMKTIAEQHPDKRGIRNNNPLNMERRVNINWNGTALPQEMNEVQKRENRFIVFRAPEFGIRAAALNLQTYLRRDWDSPKEIIDAWAPPGKENPHHDKYVAHVANALGVDPTTEVDTSSPDVLLPLIKAMIEFENGANPYSDETIMKGIGMALNRNLTAPSKTPKEMKVESAKRTTGKVAGGAGLAVIIYLIFGEEGGATLQASADTLFTEENLAALVAALAVLRGGLDTFKSWFAEERQT